MNKRSYLFAITVLFLSSSVLDAQEFGRIRALEERTVTVLKQKNDFVAKVLTSYSISHVRNTDGAVVRIHADGQWLDVNGIDVIPVTGEGADKRGPVIGHKLVFYTAKGTLELVSEMKVP